MDGKKIVFSRNIAPKYTTLTYDYDVALRIADLVGKDCALGKVYHITTEECIRWEDVLECYLDVLEQQTGNARRFVGQKKVTHTWKRQIITRFIVTESMTADFFNAKIQMDSGEKQTFYGNKARPGKMSDGIF